jgi:hypothetical protein
MELSNPEWRTLYRLLDAHPHLKPTTPERRAKLLRHGIITEVFHTKRKGSWLRTEWPKVVRLILAKKEAVADTERAELEALLRKLDQFWTENFGTSKEGRIE